MNMKFNCTNCNAVIEVDSKQAGMNCDCRVCLEYLTIPHTGKPVQRVMNTPCAYKAPSAPASEKESKTATDYAADAVCATAKAGWKFTKFIAPIVVKVAAKVTGRAVKAVAETKVVKDFKALPVKPQNKVVQGAKGLYMIWRLFGGR